MRKSYKDIKQLAGQYDKLLKANDPRFRGTVVANSILDHSHFVWANAFVMKYDDGNDSLDEDDIPSWWMIVFTEHYGVHIFHNGDVNITTLGKDKNIEELKDFMITLAKEEPK